MNTSLDYNLKIEIILIFALTDLNNFIKYYSLQNIDYFEAKNNDSITLYSESNNLSLDSFLVTSIKTNRKKDTIINTI